MEDLLRAAADKVAEIVGVPTASIVEVLPDGDAMVRAVGGDGASTHVGMRYAASPGTLTGTVLADGVSIVDGGPPRGRPVPDRAGGRARA